MHSDCTIFNPCSVQSCQALLSLTSVETFLRSTFPTMPQWHSHQQAVPLRRSFSKARMVKGGASVLLAPASMGYDMTCDQTKTKTNTGAGYSMHPQTHRSLLWHISGVASQLYNIMSYWIKSGKTHDDNMDLISCLQHRKKLMLSAKSKKLNERLSLIHIWRCRRS